MPLQSNQEFWGWDAHYRLEGGRALLPSPAYTQPLAVPAWYGLTLLGFLVLAHCACRQNSGCYFHCLRRGLLYGRLLRLRNRLVLTGRWLHDCSPLILVRAYGHPAAFRDSENPAGPADLFGLRLLDCSFPNASNACKFCI